MWGAGVGWRGEVETPKAAFEFGRACRYGSMAVSNSTGSQICNILIGAVCCRVVCHRRHLAYPHAPAGLGLPWLLATAAGFPDRTVAIPAHSVIQTAAFFQVGEQRGLRPCSAVPEGGVLTTLPLLQAGNMIVNFALLLGMALITKDVKVGAMKLCWTCA